MAHMMYPPQQHQATMPPPQKPETFMLSSEAQQSLPQDAQVALQQVDNRELPRAIELNARSNTACSEIFPHFRAS